MGRRGWGPSTHVGEEEQDPGEERDDLPGQPQVVHRGVIRVGRLGGGDTQVATQPLQPLAPDPDVPPTSPHIPVPGASSLLSPLGVPAPAGLTITHSALQWLVVGSQGEDDHGAEVGDHVDVEGDGPELAPLVAQQLVDGFHGQHLVAVLGG